LRTWYNLQVVSYIYQKSENIGLKIWKNMHLGHMRLRKQMRWAKKKKRKWEEIINVIKILKPSKMMKKASKGWWVKSQERKQHNYQAMGRIQLSTIYKNLGRHSFMVLYNYFHAGIKDTRNLLSFPFNPTGIEFISIWGLR
jgi:hypothetical protein